MVSRCQWWGHFWRDWRNLGSFGSDRVMSRKRYPGYGRCSSFSGSCLTCNCSLCVRLCSGGLVGPVLPWLPTHARRSDSLRTDRRLEGRLRLASDRHSRADGSHRAYSGSSIASCLSFRSRATREGVYAVHQWVRVPLVLVGGLLHLLLPLRKRGRLGR